MTAEKIRLEIRVNEETKYPYICDQDGRTFAGGKSSSIDFQHDDYARATITARLHANGKPMLNAGGGLRKKPDPEPSIPPEEQVLSFAYAETWGVGDVVKLREDSDGSGSAYWRIGFAYLITEKTTHGTLFVAQDVGDPVEISMGIARRWFRLARKAEKVAEQGKSEERKSRSLREIFCGFKSPSLFAVTELAMSPLTEKACLARIDDLEETVRNLREELKERKEEDGYPAERIVKLGAAALDIIAKADIGSALIYQHPDGSTTLVKRIQ